MRTTTTTTTATAATSTRVPGWSQLSPPLPAPPTSAVCVFSLLTLLPRHSARRDFSFTPSSLGCDPRFSARAWMAHAPPHTPDISWIDANPQRRRVLRIDFEAAACVGL
uniref:Uncharacterized protein n=1 Tax=Knipowitschia caucasica TaxID=637954 RepID=A0AAV2J905_KNICA